MVLLFEYVVFLPLILGAIFHITTACRRGIWREAVPAVPFVACAISITYFGGIQGLEIGTSAAPGLIPLLLTCGVCLLLTSAAYSWLQIKATDRDSLPPIMSKETVRRMVAAIRQKSEVFVLYDPRDRLVFCNEAFREINHQVAHLIVPGITFEALLRAAVAQDMMPEAKGREDTWLRERLRQHRDPGDAVVQQRLDGGWHLIQEQRLDDGSTVAIISDITRQKNVEQALRDREVHLRRITDALPMPITYVDAADCFQFVNRVAGEWAGLPASQILGRSQRDVFGGIGEAAYANIRPYADAAQAGERQLFEQRITYPDGHAREVEISYLPHVEADGQVAGFFAIAVDVTARRALEERQRQSQKVEAISHLTGGIAHEYNNILQVVIGQVDMLIDDLRHNEEAISQLQSVQRGAQRGATLTNHLLSYSQQLPLAPRAVDVGAALMDFQRLLRQTFGQARACEPFFTTKDIGQGAGLGLSMVYGFIRQSGGFTEILTAPGAGTTIRLYLPSLPPAAPAPLAILAAPAEAVGDVSVVLLVEDDEDVRELLALQIASLGYQVIQAEDGNKALALADEAARIDLLFTDVVMPGGISGISLAQTLKRSWPDLKTIFTTGHSSDVLAAAGHMEKHEILLNKPYAIAKLEAAFKEAMAE